MSLLKKPYEISIWQDKFIIDGNDSVSSGEEKLAVIGSNTMTSPNRAFEPKLVEKTNGEVDFSFQMYYRYFDNLTGEETENPFCAYLTNERKVKLNYDGKWYDFVIKSISEDSENKTFNYTLKNAFIVELSKNGFNLVLDNELMNNSGTAQELGNTILAESDWRIDENSDIIEQTIEEALYEVRLQEPLNAYQVLDPQKNQNGRYEGCSIATEQRTIAGGSTIYVFYSSIQEHPYRFQFIWVENEEDIIRDDNRIITNPNCQYIIDGFIYDDITNYTLSEKYRGKKYVFNQNTKFFPKLNRYCSKFSKDGQEYWNFIDAEYFTPEIIQNYIANNTFKSTAGWLGARLNGGTEEDKSKQVGLCSAEAVRFDNGQSITMLEDFSNAAFSDDYKYYSALRLKFQTGSSIIMNNGFTEYRDRLPQGIKTGDKFVVMLKVKSTEDQVPNIRISLQQLDYNISNGGYFTEQNVIFKTGTKTSWKHLTIDNDFEYVYQECTVSDNINFTQSDLKKTQLKIVFKPMGTTIVKTYLDIFDCQIFPYIQEFKEETEEQKEDILGFITPQGQTVQATIKDHYYYFTEDEYNAEEVESIEDLQPVGSHERTSKDKQLERLEGYVPVYDNTAQKIRSINVKESNYFNNIQVLAETFECWPQISVGHNENGTIIPDQKTITLRKYVGQDNYAGFRYNVNLKGVKRNCVSDAIVSKLIVKDNTNEFATNGFCTISRAKSNDLRDNTLFDFQYYVNQGLLDATVHQTALYGENGYFNKIREANDRIDAANNELIPLQDSLVQVKANIQLYQNTVESAESNYEDISNAFINETGFSHLLSWSTLPEEEQEAIRNKLQNSTTIKKYLKELSEYKQTAITYKQKLSEEKDKLSTLTERITDLEAEVDSAREDKANANKEFFAIFSRYIQEGTWMSEDYIDDELYYIDAMSVLYNSSMPQVDYSIDVLEISSLPGYEMFNYGLGDRTFMEDPKFFGYNKDGSCYREKIVVTETSFQLDSPDKNSIKVQNYKTQFQDLFQRITATVQSVQYSEGSYEKAAALADADAAQKVKFLQEALNDASLILQNAGDQSVKVDINGITITDVDSPSEQIRLIGGGIFLRQEMENGEQRWTTAITAKGINASLVNTGQLNTSLIQIMNGEQPSFRWDAHGITAYDFDTGLNDSFIWNINTTKGVRFDRFGLYGYDGIDGETWYPIQLSDVNANSVFSLTWEGLKVTGTDQTVATIGRHSISDKSYIMRVVNNEGKETFSITNNGIVKAEIANFKLANIGGWVIEDDFLHSDDYKIYLAPNGVDDDAISGNEETWVIKAGENFGVTPEGRVVAKKGDIAGWNISKGELACPTTEFYTIGLFSGQEYFFTSLQNNSTTSPVRFGLLSHWLATGKIRFDLYSDTTEYTISINASSCEDDFKITQSNLRFDTLPSGWVLDSVTNEVQPNEIILYLKFQSSGKSGQATIDSIMYPTKSKNLAITSGFPNFAVLADGSLYAKRAKIEGTIYANDGVFNGTIYADDGVFKGVVYANKGVFNGEVFATVLNLTRLTNQVGALEIGAKAQVATSLKTVNYKIVCKMARSGDKGYVTITPTSNSTSERFNGKFKLTAKYSDDSEYGVAIIDGSTGSILADVRSIECTVTDKEELKVIKAIAEESVVYQYTIKDENSNTSPISFINGSEYSLKYFMQGEDSGIIMGGSILPYLDYNPADQAGCDLGSADKSWRTLYCKDSTWPSDLRLKKNIEQFDETFNEMYDNLHPCRYNFIADTEEKKVHCGYIAQDIESNLNTLFPNQNFALLHKRQKENGDYYYGLEYIEFIALNTWQIQLLKPRITAAEEEIISLKAEIFELRQTIENLQNGEKSDII